MNKIYVRTNANNAEKTIRRAIESVLNQSYNNIIYYINDNGSTDGTKKIIEEFAAKDSRIVPFYNKVNRVYEDEYIRQNFCEITEIIDDDDFLCYLDADDEYYPTFLEEILKFMQEFNLDIGCCGTNILNAKNNIIVGTRKLSENLIIDGKGFANLFPVYHQFARAVWGKVYRGFTLRDRVLYEDPNDFTFPSYGIDTVLTLKAFSKANKVGILAGVLHNYYFSEKSVSYRLDPKRVISDQLQHQMTIEYLMEYGPISKNNMNFLYAVYCNAILDTIKVVTNSDENKDSKLKLLYDILMSKITWEMLFCNEISINNKIKVIQQIYIWMKKCKINRINKESVTIYYKILTIICNYRLGRVCRDLDENFTFILFEKAPLILDCIIMENPTSSLKILNNTYVTKCNHIKELNLFKILLMNIIGDTDQNMIDACKFYLQNFPNDKYKNIILDIIYMIMQNNTLLNNLSIDFYTKYNIIIDAIIKKDYDIAFQYIIIILNENNIKDNYAEQFYLTGQNIACVLENQEAFIYFKKLSICFYINNNFIEKAKEELNDFDKLLPEDQDFNKFRKIIINNAAI